MALSSEQRAALKAEAERRGVDVDELIAAAELELEGDDAGDEKNKTAGKAAPAAAAAPAQPPLYQYHLPFVTVNEVREKWLGLGPVAGGEMYAGEWIAKQTSSASSSRSGGDAGGDS